jgi:hypothetical protein
VTAWRSGQTAAEYSKQHGLTLTSLLRWSHRQRREAPEPPAVTAAIRLARVERVAAGNASNPTMRIGATRIGLPCPDDPSPRNAAGIESLAERLVRFAERREARFDLVGVGQQRATSARLSRRSHPARVALEGCRSAPIPSPRIAPRPTRPGRPARSPERAVAHAQGEAQIPKRQALDHTPSSSSAPVRASGATSRP